MPAQKVFIGVAWPYANGPRHIGHVAGFGVPSDIFARYHRMRGNDVLMVSGTDEHGTPVTVAADAEGVTPAEVAERYNAIIASDLERLGLSYDLFTRTTTATHRRVVQDLFTVLHDKGYLVRQTQLGAFSPTTGRALPDRYIEGTCPHCGYTGARGDQCDNCGKQLDPVDLIDPRSRIDGAPPEFRDSEHFLFDLPAFADALRDWISPRTDWRPNIKRFSLNFIDELKPRAITRDIDWGVGIPLPEYADRDDKRIYVWFDAVIGYLSAAIEWAESVGSPDAWREWWQDPDAIHLYFMGKDNIVFHSVMWPSILLGYGDGSDEIGGGAPLRLPDNVVSSEFLTMEGRKFSSSRGVVIYVRDFLERYDADALRFFLTVAGPESADTDFTWEQFVRRNNDELVATWGNLGNRVLRMAEQLGGTVPEPGELTTVDRDVMAAVEGGFDTVGGLIEAASFKAALNEALRLAGQVNRYISDMEPWKLRTEDPPRAATVIYTALQCLNNLKLVLAPFLPFSSQALHALLGHDDVCAPQPRLGTHTDTGGTPHTVLRIDPRDRFAAWRATALPVGQALQAPSPLFRKLQPSVIEEELARMEREAQGAAQGAEV
ncbi:methionine--tRNA ligase [soil metagenome]